MPYPLNSEVMYMMPTHFGPMSGPRQGPGGEMFEFEQDQRKIMTVSVSFLTNSLQLKEFLPPGFELTGDPVVTIFEKFMKDIYWLAGRGYNMLGVTFPVSFKGNKDRATGPFLTVLWENLTEPILTGREQLGFSKIFCDLPEPNVCNGETHCTASWMGFKFMDIKLKNLKEINPQQSSLNINEYEEKSLRGTIHYKYIPRTGEWGKTDAEYAVLTPEPEKPSPVERLYKGRGEITFHKARWEDLPTQYMIVNALSALEIKEYRSATISYSTGGRSLSNQRILY